MASKKSKKAPEKVPSIAVYLVSLGCAKNQVDAEVMIGTLVTSNIYVTTDLAYADIVLINTCGFIQDSRDEAAKFIEEAIAWKEGYPAGKIVVSGCWAQREPQVIQERFPQVDAIVGIDEVPNIHLILQEVMKRESVEDVAPMVRIPENTPQYLYDDASPRVLTSPQSYAYVKIADGCNHRCSFCAIPDIRGKQRSRSMESVEKECRMLLQQGVKELNIIAQDSTAYGRDLPEKPELADLLEKLDALEGDFWIRVLYTHPLHITPRFLELLAKGKHIVPYLDVPLQHIDDAILKSMRRGSTQKATMALLEGIRKDYPQMVIRTSLITGYPGESTKAFNALKDFVKTVEFNHLGVFVFSPEPGTPAAEITEELVAVPVAKRRRRTIMNLHAEIAAKRNHQLINQKVRVLLDEQISKNVWSGRTAGDAPEVDQVVMVKAPKANQASVGSFVWAKIREVDGFELIADLVEEA